MPMRPNARTQEVVSTLRRRVGESIRNLIKVAFWVGVLVLFVSQIDSGHDSIWAAVFICFASWFSYQAGRKDGYQEAKKEDEQDEQDEQDEPTGPPRGPREGAGRVPDDYVPMSEWIDDVGEQGRR